MRKQKQTKQTKTPGQRSPLWPRIKMAILKYPDQFDMANWFKLDELSSRSIPFRKRNIGRCGTAACMAGWAIHLKNGKVSDSLRKTHILSRVTWVDRKAKMILNLNDAETDRLFYHEGWPRKFYRKYELATTPLQRAKAAVARIDYFIKTGQ